ncbi:hypothetical protein K5D34_23685 [Pseudomonas cichorii]|nr:hypothetical protein [Pseudomonas cichorii]MBX8512693.1 hypothetical protein [Pseudomonas cichorii]MBX8527644.1 hypothetical protein [Pseudomonas cichorii]MBX8535682.1 hypothetical protein [Pseudomonas cichorii]MBX8569726.1 hypothetical protein [Pseudomonas cichorii]MBX8602692.1 hypothetical protein [Pseudomonas cichorii]
MSIQYTQFNGSGSPVLPPNQKMTPGQFLLSPNGRFRLELHDDGNLVIKDNGVVIWVADNSQPYSLTLSRKQKGAPWLVVSNSGFLYDPARSRLWVAESTHTKDKSHWYHSHMSMQDDGNLIIYDDRAGNLLWARSGFIPGRHNKTIRVLVEPFKIYTWRF